MTRMEQLGHKIGDKFVMIVDSNFNGGDVVQFIRDDGSSIPYFKGVTGKYEGEEMCEGITHMKKLPEDAPALHVDYSVSVSTKSTLITVAKPLTTEQVAAILKIIGE